MPTRPRLKLGAHLLPGLVAVALFVVLSVVFVAAPFEGGQGFPGDASITASIGYAMFNLDGGAVPSEEFLVAFEIIDFVLVAALVAAVMLARREGASILETVRATREGGGSEPATDGGPERGPGDSGPTPDGGRHAGPGAGDDRGGR